MAANVNNYIAAANAAVSKNVQIRKALADNKPNYANLANASVNQAARNRANAAANNASTAETAIRGKTLVEGEKIKADTEKDIRGINKKARMTGMLAGGAALLGIGAIEMNKEEEPDARLELLQQQNEYWKNRYEQAGKDVDEAGARYDALTKQMKNGGGKSGDSGGSSSSSNSGGSSTSSSNSSSNSSSQYAGLQGGAKTLADAIAKFESGGYGYEAFNQGGSNNGRTVLGKSGNYKELMGGRSLTDMTLGEIFDKQNTKAKGMSMDEHIKSGGLHAVGRYQFIGSTLQDETSRMGLSLDTKFTPEIQDKIFLNHVKRVGDISPWVGPSDNYSESEKANFRNIIQGL